MNPSKRKTLTTLLAAASTVVLGTATGTVQAQTFPERPIRVVVPFAAGNTLDQALRVVSEQIKKSTGQQLLIDNKPGGSGIIAAQAVMNSAPDGYTVLLSTLGMFCINPHTFSKLPYDPEKSFRHVTGFVGASMAFAVHSSVPVNNLREFVAWAKTKGSGASYASWTAGNASHFAGVLLNERAGLNLMHVPFNGTPPVVQNLVGGQIESAFLPPLALKQHAESGKVKVLAVTSPKRSALMPSVPTFTEEGYPDLDIYIWSGLTVPAETPQAIVSTLHQLFDKAMRSPEVQEKFRSYDFQAMTLTPQEFTQYVQKDNKRWAEAVRISGFKANE